MFTLARLASIRRILTASTRLSKSAYSKTTEMADDELYVKEVRIPVPWGHIAGKAWGDPGGKRVLALHGWLDNAGSFDKLLPLLSKDLFVVAIDWPGHGLSSHRPKGCRYDPQNYIVDIKLVVDELKWDKFMILAHSMGGGSACWFAASLPEMVEAAVLLEGLGYWSEDVENLPKRMGRALRGVGDLDRKEDKVYPTWDVAIDRMIEAHVQLDTDFDREAASVLALRGIKQVQGGYLFTRDLRAKAQTVLRVAHEVNNAFLSAIQCPVLAIMAENTFLPGSVINSRLEAMNKDDLKLVKVCGGHHAHLCQPAAVGRLINVFLLTKTLHPDYKELSKL